MGVIFDGMSNDEAMLWYGVTAFINAAPTIAALAIWNNSPFISAYKMGIILKQFAWWPVALTWVYTYIHDTKLNRVLLDHAVSLSTLDPYAFAWVGLNAALIHKHDSGEESTWITWAALGAWATVTIWEMVM